MTRSTKSTVFPKCFRNVFEMSSKCLRNVFRAGTDFRVGEYFRTGPYFRVGTYSRAGTCPAGFIPAPADSLTGLYLSSVSPDQHVNDDRGAEHAGHCADIEFRRGEGHAGDQVADHAEDSAAQKGCGDDDDRFRGPTAMPTKDTGPAKAVTQADRMPESRIRAARKRRMFTPMLCA